MEYLYPFLGKIELQPQGHAMRGFDPRQNPSALGNVLPVLGMRQMAQNLTSPICSTPFDELALLIILELNSIRLLPLMVLNLEKLPIFVLLSSWGTLNSMQFNSMEMAFSMTPNSKKAFL